MLLEAVVIRSQNIGLTMSRLPGLAKPDQLFPAERMGISPSPVCQDNVIEAAITNRAEKSPAVPEHPQTSVTMALLMLL